MKIKVNIHDIKKVNEFDFYWTEKDFMQLLEDYDFQDAASVPKEEIKDFLYLAISEFEPAEAAEVLLKYKLSDVLNDGQIQSISNEMADDKIAEEYPDPALHYDLFNINQLLYKAYNGTFPNTEASILKIEFIGKDDLDNEEMIKAIAQGLTDRSVIHRLYADQLAGEIPFGDASKIIWHVNKKEDNMYEVFTSNYWIDKEDIAEVAYTANIVMHEEEEED